MARKTLNGKEAGFPLAYGRRPLYTGRMKKIFKISGIFCLGYYTILIGRAGIRTAFASFWAATAAAFWALSRLPEKTARAFRLPALFGGAAIGVLCFRMTRAGRRKPEPGADHVVILGAHVRGTRPSRSLLYRIEAAAKYMKAEPAAVAIASGGQGDGEDISEACCIRHVLEKMGIERSRIIEEDRSVSTWQNLEYSLDIGGRDASYVIVTNRFHIYRALKTAKAVGMEHFSGLGAPSHPVFGLNYFVREIFALAKMYTRLILRQFRRKEI